MVPNPAEIRGYAQRLRKLMTMKRMRIGLFTDSDVFAGTERHMLDLAPALKQLGTEVTLMCPERGILAERARACGVPVIAVEKHGSMDWRAVFTLRDLLRRGRIEVLHCHNGRTAFLGALGCLFAGHGRLVLTQHFIAPAYATRSGWKGMISRRIHRWLNRRLAAMIAISESVRAATLERANIEPSKVTVVPNGISDPMDSPLRERNTVRGETVSYTHLTLPTNREV